MAEALSVVGLVASVVTFAEITTKMLARFREFHSNAWEMPKVFQDITRRLPPIADMMARIEKECRDGTLTVDAQDKLLRVVDGCSQQVSLLDEVIKKMLPTPTDSRRRRALKAIESVRKENGVVEILETLGRYERTLTLHFGQRSGDSATIAKREATYYEIPSLGVSQSVERVELLKEIKASFANSTGNATPKVVVLLGMGGQGKTQLALEYCRATRAPETYQAIFWIDASSVTTVLRGFETIAAKISGFERLFDDAESKVVFVKETLRQWRIRWLIVFDNYDQPDKFKNISDFFPQGRTGAILLTSRHTESKRLGISINVTGMTEDEGLELLLRQSELEPIDHNVTEGKKIIKTLGYLPLAIDQAGAYISARRLPLQHFLKHYGERREVVLKHTPSLSEYRRRVNEDEDETLLSVFTTWELSFQQIGESEDERMMIGHFLTLSAFLDSTNVSEDLFKSHLASTDKPPLWTERFLSQGVWDKYKYQDTVVDLLSLSLLQTMDVGIAELRFSLHPLVADWLKLRTDHKGRQKYTIEATIILTNYINALDQNALPLQIRTDILSHVDMCLQNDREYLQGLKESDVPSLQGSANTFASLYYSHGRYQEAGAMYNRALAEKEKVLGPNHPSTLDTVSDLGTLYNAQGRLAEAEAMYDRSLAGKKKALGPNHRSTLNTVNNLGRLYQNQGRLAEAEAMYKRALAGGEKALGPNHPSTLDTVNSLGNLYKDQGRLAEAEAMYDRSLAGKKNALGPNHPSTLDTVNDLGSVYKYQGRLAEAEAMYDRSLAGKEKALGPDHPSTLDTVDNLGSLYKDQGRLAEAEAMYERALVGNEKALGPDHPSTLGTVNNLGNLYMGQGRLAKAEAMYDRSLAGKEKTLGPNHPSTLGTVNNLGSVYKYQGRLAEAEAMYDRSLVGKEKAQGPNHLSMLDTIENLGSLYKDQGRLAEAEAMYEQALVGNEKALGPDHPSTLVTVNNLGSVYNAQGKLAEAEAMYDRSLAGNEKALGPNHPSTLDTVNNLGSVYKDQGRLAEAEAMYDRSLAGREKALGPDHPSTLDTVNSLGNLYKDQGRLAEAELMYVRAPAREGS